MRKSWNQGVNWWCMMDFMILTFASRSSRSVLTPNRATLLEMPGPCVTFLIPLIWVMSRCCCCFLFLSRDFGGGDRISSSFCLSVRERFRSVSYANVPLAQHSQFITVHDLLTHIHFCSFILPPSGGFPNMRSVCVGVWVSVHFHNYCT